MYIIYLIKIFLKKFWVFRLYHVFMTSGKHFIVWREDRYIYLVAKKIIVNIKISFALFIDIYNN